MHSSIDWLEAIEHWLGEYGVSEAVASPSARAIAVIAIVVASILANFVAKRFILVWVKAFAKKTESHWDDFLVKRHVFDRLSHLAPALVIYGLMPLAFHEMGEIGLVIQRGAVAYMIVAGTLAIDAFFSAANDVYNSLPVARSRPITTYVQVVKIVVYMIAAILVLAALLDRSPWGLLTGLGAMTAVIMLVFKDTILGFVASVQLLRNDMVRRGDWIEVPKFGADGDVIDITVATVKVQNWDKTISMVPTYALISESFKNWRGMSESGGRRIKRAIHIDMNSIELCTPKMLDRFERMELITDYVRERRKEIDEHNRKHGVDSNEHVNGRHMTNVGTFRAYVVAYLKQNPKVRQDMTFIVRQLPPEATGLPIEIYVFSSDQVWANYEAIQADIFDHLLAVLPEFGLRVYQYPGGADLRGAAGPRASTVSRGDALGPGRAPTQSA